jgi:hypothetical protein
LSSQVLVLETSGEPAFATFPPVPCPNTNSSAAKTDKPLKNATGKAVSPVFCFCPQTQFAVYHDCGVGGT